MILLPRSVDCGVGGGGVAARVIEGIVWRYWTGLPWRDLPECFRWTWDRLVIEVSADVDAASELDWVVAVDSSINRARRCCLRPFVRDGSYGASHTARLAEKAGIPTRRYIAG